MKKPKVIEFNLAELTEEKLIKTLNDNNAQMGELLALLESLFDMFSTSLHFSKTVIEYADERHEHFLEKFIEITAKTHGVPPESLVSIVQVLREAQQIGNPSPAIH